MIPSLVMKRTLGWLVVPIVLFALGSCQEQEEPQEVFQLLEATLPQIQAALASGTITSQDLVEKYLARIAAYDQQGPSLNAIITVNPNALAEAKELDAERAANGPRGPLHGIPVIVKDNYENQEGSNGCFSANSGLSTITVPAGFTDQGLPVGLELLGRAWSEARLIGLAYAFEQATQHRRPPTSTPSLSGAR